MTVLKRHCLLCVTKKTQLRAMFYFAMSLALHPDGELEGVVIILNVGKNRVYYEELPHMIKNRHIYQSMPGYAHAMHYCYDDLVLYPFVTAVQFLIRSRMEGRFISHYGASSQIVLTCDVLMKSILVSQDRARLYRNTNSCSH